jgi:prepilin-type processing-associated H-X9-DG protein
LLLTAVMGLGLVGLLASHPRSAPRWQRTECANHLRQIALALHDYHQVYGCLPPAHVDGPGGKPMHSWRVLILPFLHYEKLYQQYDFAEPWNSPKNSLLAKRIPHEYRCPAAQEANSWATNYVAVVGPATAWPGSKCVRFQDIKDGTSDTILLVEVADATIPWMEPRDMRFSRAIVGVNMDRHRGIGSHHRGGANISLADGSTRFLPNSISPAAIRTLLTLADGESIDDDEDGRLFVRPGPQPRLPTADAGDDTRE